MFKQRLLSALVLIPIVLGAILYANGWLLGGLLALVLCVAGYEWMRLIPLSSSTVIKVSYFSTLILLTFLCWQFYLPWLWTGVFVWCVLIVFILTYPRSVTVWGYPIVVALFSGCLLPLVFSGLAVIYQQVKGAELVIYLLFLVWAADTGGYLFGKQWGQTRLIPQVSPGKTIAGTLGGLLLTLAVAEIGAWWFKPTNEMLWFMIAGCIFIFALFGDLLISMLKRRVQIKDTGALIPGHGGILDRVDSLIAAIPIFAWMLVIYPGLIAS